MIGRLFTSVVYISDGGHLQTISQISFRNVGAVVGFLSSAFRHFGLVIYSGRSFCFDCWLDSHLLAAFIPAPLGKDLSAYAVTYLSKLPSLFASFLAVQCVFLTLLYLYRACICSGIFAFGDLRNFFVPIGVENSTCVKPAASPVVVCSCFIEILL